jgi:tetratricopeptide (TPR) repeat protein
LGRFSGFPSGLNTGLGFSFADYRLDYAFAPLGDLGASHRFGFSCRFGDGKNDEPRVETRARKPSKPKVRKESLDAEPEGVDRNLQLADRLINIGRLEDARRELGRAQELLEEGDRRHVLVLERMGHVSFLEEDFQDGMARFRDAIRTAVSSGVRGAAVAKAYYGLGMCLAAGGKTSAAIRYFETALESDPDSDIRQAIKSELKRLKK